MNQFYSLQVTQPLLPSEIKPRVQFTAVGYLAFLGTKGNGIMNGCECAEGKLHRVCKAKG